MKTISNTESGLLKNETHDWLDYKKALVQSQPMVEWVAEWFRGQGYQVVISQLVIAPSAEVWIKYAKPIDMFVKINGLWQPTEVKHSGTTFYSMDTYPWSDFMVCAKEAYDHAVELGMRPFLYVIVSQDYSCLALAYTDRQDKWWIGTYDDYRRINGLQDKYMCHKEDIVWRRPDENL